MTTFVWVDAWQQQCCGDDFSVGSTVDWNATAEAGADEWVTMLLGEEWGRKVEFHEEHHEYDREDQACTRVSGVVKSIRVVTCDRVVELLDGTGPAKTMVPVLGSGRLREVGAVDPRDSEPSIAAADWFDGWIVELEVNGRT